MAEQLKMPEMAQKVHKFLEAKQNEEIFNQEANQQQASKQSTKINDKRVVAAPIGIQMSDKFKSDAPADLVQKPIVEKPEQNPFGKKAQDASNTQKPSEDIFSQLQSGKTAKVEKKNPFAPT